MTCRRTSTRTRFQFENANILLRFQVPSIRKRRKRCNESASIETLSRVEVFENAAVSASCGRVEALKIQTFENDWSCNLSPSPLTSKGKRKKKKKWRIWTENVLVLVFCAWQGNECVLNKLIRIY